MEQVRSCGFLIVRGTPVESFLLMRHTTRWDLPKGHVDPGETDIQCAYRELWEETGIGHDAVEMDPVFQFQTEYPVRRKKQGDIVNKTLIVFLGRLCQEVAITPTEHPGFEWVPWQPPHQIQTATIDPLLAELDRFLATNGGERS